MARSPRSEDTIVLLQAANDIARQLNPVYLGTLKVIGDYRESDVDLLRVNQETKREERVRKFFSKGFKSVTFTDRKCLVSFSQYLNKPFLKRAQISVYDQPALNVTRRVMSEYGEDLKHGYEIETPKQIARFIASMPQYTD